MTAATKRKMDKIHRELSQRLELYRNERYNEEIRKEMKALAYEVLAKHVDIKARKNIYAYVSIDKDYYVTIEYKDLGANIS